MRSISCSPASGRSSPARPLLTTRCRPGARSRRRNRSPSHSCSSTRPGSATSSRNGSYAASSLLGRLGPVGSARLVGVAGTGGGAAGGRGWAAAWRGRSPRERRMAAAAAWPRPFRMQATRGAAGASASQVPSGQLVAAADQAGLVRPVVPGRLPGALGEFIADPGQQDRSVRPEADDRGAHASIPALRQKVVGARPGRHATMNP